MSVLMLSGLVYMLNMGLSPLQQQLLLLYLKFEKLSATSYLKEEKINKIKLIRCTRINLNLQR